MTTELVEAMARAIPDKIPRCLLYLPREDFDAVLAYVAFRMDQAHRAGEVAMRERAELRADYEKRLAEDNIDCGYDLRFNQPAKETARRIATAISALEPEGMGDG